IVPHETISFVRGVCGAFLFPGGDVDKPIGVLSGGERARVCIAKILVKPGNFLVLDEPTNHLDLISSEVLIDALAGFKGTMLFVSHNQSFINRLGTRIWDIRDGNFLDYPGRLYEYYDHLAGVDYEPFIGPQQVGKEEQDPIKKSLKKDRQSKKTKRKEKAEERRLIDVTLNPIRNELGKLEGRIAGLENKEKELEEILADSEIFRDKDKSIPLLKEYSDIRAKLEELMLRWEYKHDELEIAKKELEIL
ncbi:MAG: ATP-binding cassette domain-containing protein, partial [Thermodesulfobacteriota bacterium]|nr:ATP-binding cassette domain-containing protein [Thermodesulfobacteriota bacterium]